jgi:hypothetical protein
MVVQFFNSTTCYGALAQSLHWAAGLVDNWAFGIARWFGCCRARSYDTDHSLRAHLTVVSERTQNANSSAY